MYIFIVKYDKSVKYMSNERQDVKKGTANSKINLARTITPTAFIVLLQIDDN
jgi:hypothetical protein